MTFPQILLIVIVAIPLALALLDKLRMDLAALSMAITLGIAQFFGLGMLGAAHSPADATRAISGFRQPVVITLLSLFIITRGLEASGITRWITRRLMALGGRSETRLIVLFAASSALLSLFMNNLAAGALLLPSAVEAARRTKIKPSKLLIPVAYGSLLGGCATYFTTANIVVSDLLEIAQPPQAPLHILDFTPAGGLIAMAGIAYLALVGKRLLPERTPPAEQVLIRPSASELEEYYRLDERLWEASVLPDSPLKDKTLAQTCLGEDFGVAVAAIWRGQQAIFAPLPDERVQAGDVLLVVGRQERVEKLAGRGLTIGREEHNGPISMRGVSFVEVILSPRSPALGQTLRQLDFRRTFGFTAVALWHKDRSYRTDVADMPLSLGDSFLAIGSRDRLKKLENDPDFIVLEPHQSAQPVQQRQAIWAIAITLGAVAVSIAGLPVYLAMLAGAVLVVLAGVITMAEAYRSVEWPAVFLIAGMYAVSLAMVQTGLAELIGHGMVSLVAAFGPLGLAAGSYLLTALLTQVMGGQVTALVTGPVAISAAIHLHTNPQAIAVATAIGCSASFLTPLAHPVNILMIAPANYKFGDFFRVGWGLTLVSFVMLLVGMALFWKL